MVERGGQNKEIEDKTNRTWRKRGWTVSSRLVAPFFPLTAKTPEKGNSETKARSLFAKNCKEARKYKNTTGTFFLKPAKVPRLPIFHPSVHGEGRAIFKRDFHLHIYRNQHCTSQG